MLVSMPTSFSAPTPCFLGKLYPLAEFLWVLGSNGNQPQGWRRVEIIREEAWKVKIQSMKLRMVGRSRKPSSLHGNIQPLCSELHSSLSPLGERAKASQCLAVCMAFYCSISVHSPSDFLSSKLKEPISSEDCCVVHSLWIYEINALLLIFV